MGRAERRKLEKTKTKPAVYNMTKEQLDTVVYNSMQEQIKKAKKEATQDAIVESMSLLLALPIKVLMDYYWPKSYKKKIPEFTKHILDYYEMYENGDLSYDDLKNEVWELAGVRFEVEESK